MTKYRVLNRDDFPRERPESNSPTVNFSVSTGVVYFSKGACELIGIGAGDRVEVLQSEDNPSHFGFRKTDSEKGFKVRPKKAGQCFAAIRLVSRLVIAMGSTRTTTVQLGSERIDGAYWAITKSARRKE